MSLITDKTNNGVVIASRAGTSQKKWGVEERSAFEETAALLTKDVSLDSFLGDLLKIQCRRAGADGGVVIRLGKEVRYDILATYPPPRTKNTGPKWIVTAAKYAREVVSSGRTLMKPENLEHPAGDKPLRQIIVIPIQNEATVRAVSAFIVSAHHPEDLSRCRDWLELTPILINAFEMQRALKDRRTALDRLRVVLEMLSAVNNCNRFMSAAMALCNESASRWRCNRVSLGFLNSRYVHVQAMSHTDKFNRKMKLLQDIEATMEECLDQDIEVIHPAKDGATYIDRAAAHLSKDHGPETVLSLPIRRGNEVPAVLTLERPLEQPFSLNEIETIRLVCDLCAPRLVELREHDRWFGARMAASMRNSLSQLLGPKHTWLKISAILIFCLGCFLTFAKGAYRVESPFVFESTVHQVVVSPIDTFIKSVSVVPGDKVEAGKTILGVLETSEIRLKLAALKAEQISYQKEMAISIRDRNTVESQIAQAQDDKITSEIRLLEQQIGQATLVAPITGRIISEDLKKEIGAPVEKGKILFEIASIESLRAELYVPEEFIVDVTEQQEGELASVGHPDQRIGFIVERINPIADVVNDRNIFKVRVRLFKQYEWMRPGMEGVAKISAGKKSYIWIGTRRLINWLRMKLWFW